MLPGCLCLLNGVHGHSWGSGIWLQCGPWVTAWLMLLGVTAERHEAKVSLFCACSLCPCPASLCLCDCGPASVWSRGEQVCVHLLPCLSLELTLALTFPSCCLGQLLRPDHMQVLEIQAYFSDFQPGFPTWLHRQLAQQFGGPRDQPVWKICCLWV